MKSPCGSLSDIVAPETTSARTAFSASESLANLSRSCWLVVFDFIGWPAEVIFLLN
jgi:hypothetical protein